jgi:hypothetical protein
VAISTLKHQYWLFVAAGLLCVDEAVWQRHLIKGRAAESDGGTQGGLNCTSTYLHMSAAADGTPTTVPPAWLACRLAGSRGLQ